MKTISMVEPIIVGNLVLDGEAVCHSDGTYTDSQQGWENFFLSIGKRIPTVKEYIITLKKLDERNDPALQGILQDLWESRLCAGKINYDKSNLPVGDGYLDVLVKDSAWRRGLEDEMFQYDAPETMDMLQRVSGKRPYIWTPDAAERKSYPERAVWLDVGSGRFYLYCYYIPVGISGRARGVREISATDMNIEQKIQAAPEIKLLPPAIIKDYNNNPARPLYNPNDLEYVKRRMAGIPS